MILCARLSTARLFSIPLQSSLNFNHFIPTFDLTHLCCTEVFPSSPLHKYLFYCVSLSAILLHPSTPFYLHVTPKTRLYSTPYCCFPSSSIWHTSRHSPPQPFTSHHCTPFYPTTHYSTSLHSHHNTPLLYALVFIALHIIALQITPFHFTPPVGFIILHSTLLLSTPHHYYLLHIKFRRFTPSDWPHPIPLRCTSLHFTSLQSTPLCSTLLHFTLLDFTSLHSTPLHFTTLYSTSLPCTPLHYPVLHFTTLYSTSLPSTPFHYPLLHFTTFYSTLLHFTPLHSTSLHFTSLYSTSLHSILFHFTPLHCTSHHISSLHSTSFLSKVLSIIHHRTSLCSASHPLYIPHLNIIPIDYTSHYSSSHYSTQYYFFRLCIIPLHFNEFISVILLSPFR